MAVKARQFYVTLSEVVKRASKDATLPPICAVQFVVKNNVLFMIATDRFKVAVGRIEAEGLEDGTWLAGRGDVEALLGTMRAHKLGSTKSDKNLVELTPGDMWKIATQRGVELTLRTNWDAGFPKVQHFIPNDWEQGVTVDGAQIGADKNYLYSFDTERDGKPQVFASKPDAGFDVVGVVMPVREPDGERTWKRCASIREELEGK